MKRNKEIQQNTDSCSFVCGYKVIKAKKKTSLLSSDKMKQNQKIKSKHNAHRTHNDNSVKGKKIECFTEITKK